MSHNSFGQLFRVTTWGESHGPAIGCVIDGTPPLLALSEGDIQPWLDRRRPGTSRFVTQRQEADQVRILSGTYEGQTTGTPISLLIENEDQRSKDYSAIADTSGRGTRITPIMPNTASATRVAAAAHRPGKPPAGSPPAPWRARCWAPIS